MENQSETGANQKNPKLILGVAVLLAVVGIILLLAIVRPATNSFNLLPVLANPTVPQSQADSLTPVAVTFSELNADPLSFLNMPIQVSGSFIKLDPASCAPFTGPNPQWALVSEDLQLEAKGFERIVQILPNGTDMVVEGIWRLYQGPLGCGKGPAVGSAWYLQVQRILQPNPLVRDGSSGLIGIEGAAPGLPNLLATNIPTATTPPQSTEAPLATATIDQLVPTTALSTATPDSSLIGTPTVTSLPTSTPSSGGTTPLASATPSATSTLGSGGNLTPTPQTPLPPTATQDSGGGYPGNPTVTPSPNPYP
ncbi:MAG: hypothetical protein ACK2T4_05780 [Candidatus Promineifilaceae bacterium]|jgi:hypothetical protein